MENNRIEKYLCKLLRHDPEDLILSKDGYVPVSDILKKLNINEAKLREIVSNSSKQRLAFNQDKTCIRANQGHSISIEIQFKEVVPPAILYHGTKTDSLHLLQKFGIKKMQRHHVHLSADEETAKKVGSRRGRCSIVKIDTQQMYSEGIKFYLSENGVYLTDYVDPKYFIY